MSGISKTIEQVRERREVIITKFFSDSQEVRDVNDALEVITAYEQSQEELEWLQGRLKPIAKERDLLIEESAQRAIKLETANKRIAELEALLKGVQPSVETHKLYSEITRALYVVKEQTDD